MSLDFYIGKRIKTHNNTDSIISNFLILDETLYIRTDDYRTYEFSKVQLDMYGFTLKTDDSEILKNPDDLFESRELCLDVYSDFKIEKVGVDFYYGHYNDIEGYIRRIPYIDLFQTSLWFAEGIGIYRNLKTLLKNNRIKHLKVVENDLFINNSAKVYRITKPLRIIVHDEMDWIEEFDNLQTFVTVYPLTDSKMFIKRIGKNYIHFDFICYDDLSLESLYECLFVW